MRKIVSLIAVGVLALILAACSSKPLTLLEKYEGVSAEQLFNQGEEALAQRNYRYATEYFEAMDALYPFGEYSEQSQLNIIYAYYKNDDYTSAIAAADRFIRVHPLNEHVDYAFFMRGVAHFEEGRTLLQRYLPIDLSTRELTSIQQAFNDFNILIKRFPDSRYAADSRQRMIYLRNLLAQHEISVARYYIARAAYLAAVNRAGYVVRHYQYAPEVAEALYIMTVGLSELGLSEQADEAFRVLRLNYPNSRWYHQAVKELS